MTYIAHRTERVGMGDLTFDLVGGEPVTANDGSAIPQEYIDVLVSNQQVYDDEAPVGHDTYSQEYRNSASVNREISRFQPVQYVDPATGAIERSLDGPDNNDPEAQARLAMAPDHSEVQMPDESVIAESTEGSLDAHYGDDK